MFNNLEHMLGYRYKGIENKDPAPCMPVRQVFEKPPTKMGRHTHKQTWVEIVILSICFNLFRVPDGWGLLNQYNSDSVRYVFNHRNVY